MTSQPAQPQSPEARAMTSPEELLERLEACTRSLEECFRKPPRNAAGNLLDQRQRLIRELTVAIGGGRLENGALEKLKALRARGDEIRQILLIKRETLRIELQQKRDGRHMTDCFRPAAPAPRARLNVRI
jgi:hypothetical protein